MRTTVDGLDTRLPLGTRNNIRDSHHPAFWWKLKRRPAALVSRQRRVRALDLAMRSRLANRFLHD